MLDFLFVENRYLLQYATFAGLALFAWRHGDAPEKLVSLVFVSAIVFEIVHHATSEHGDSSQVDVAHTLLDLAMFASLAAIAMRANRIYPLWILAAQLIATAMHFERGVIESMAPLAYWVLIRLPSYFQILIFAIGLMANYLRKRRGVQSRPWRSNLPH